MSDHIHISIAIRWGAISHCSGGQQKRWPRVSGPIGRFDRLTTESPRLCRGILTHIYLRNQKRTRPYPTPAGSVVRAAWNAMKRPSVATTGFDALPPS